MVVLVLPILVEEAVAVALPLLLSIKVELVALV